MSHYCNDTIRTPDFNHLSMTERVKIEAGLRHGLSPASIAREIGRAPSTVKREIKRGMGKQISGGRERLAHLAEAGQARYGAARAKGGAPRKDGLKFVRDVERRMRKSREANLPAGPDGFVGAAAASGKYGPGETVTTR
ncbi:MAG: helix-turn-helix domain-containing protein, partial [Eubacteriaceae bacterium]|nr:helix-turn-helix domain-containing protein [Eubacteriaceae bacterium]